MLETQFPQNRDRSNSLSLRQGGSRRSYSLSQLAHSVHVEVDGLAPLVEAMVLQRSFPQPARIEERSLTVTLVPARTTDSPPATGDDRMSRFGSLSASDDMALAVLVARVFAKSV
jgi:hypothetical protein